MALAHASVLLGDLGRDHDANRYGRAALLCLQEADASEAPAWYALAKTARWRHDYATAADMASRGFHEGPVTPMSVQLASYEANAAALLGDSRSPLSDKRSSGCLLSCAPAIRTAHSAPPPKLRLPGHPANPRFRAPGLRSASALPSLSFSLASSTPLMQK